MIMTYRVMPGDGDVEYSQLEKVTKETIGNYDQTAKVNWAKELGMSFGIKAVQINFSVDEARGSEALEEQLKKIEEVGDVIVESMSRAMG